jgi:hypothetical protein
MAAELPTVPLADGLELLLLARDVEQARFDRAGPRWHARLCSEQQLSSGEAQLALAALNALAGPAAQSAAQSLAAVCESHGLGREGSGVGDLAQSPLKPRPLRTPHPARADTQLSGDLWRVAFTRLRKRLASSSVLWGAHGRLCPRPLRREAGRFCGRRLRHGRSG